MKPPHRQITLKHLLINQQKMIGLQFYSDKVIQALVKELPSPRWSKEYKMVYIENKKENLGAIFQKFRGEAWVNCQYFFPNRPVNNGHEDLDINHFRKRELPESYRACPEAYIQKLRQPRQS